MLAFSDAAWHNLEVGGIPAERKGKAMKTEILNDIKEVQDLIDQLEREGNTNGWEHNFLTGRHYRLLKQLVKVAS